MNNTVYTEPMFRVEMNGETYMISAFNVEDALLTAYRIHYMGMPCAKEAEYGSMLRQLGVTQDNVKFERVS